VRVIGVEWVPERIAVAERHGVETVDLHAVDDPREEVLARTAGRRADPVIRSMTPPSGRAIFGDKEQGAIKVALTP
jgi:threonine dehydrogenase-like Zn-dependent dehydrogenase